ncbi:low molecular weight phosphatase family protein [Myroides odoratimimus]|uniref:Protein-tyrosine-phosphatase n=1 Tax=Myroides odoratimimus TaxID=76832 RepID=A0AAI8C5V3_9FLAO|nr:protein-tyrosine-phosphatase [Myroides odoratimimus]ALU26565.1 protein-tyrosine-phosphatase [Myroides odoratimimus]MDM1036954.1 protein-tyrosine-phosphatase [Myroides odoratimimus]MDM1051972.1 protein-tyrosine-phosphatase [Myroides odoratimimus]MDM1085968.1 protein-tyrosine-phosphatase [Myroides odoratimimus]
MYKILSTTISTMLESQVISDSRKEVLAPLVAYIQSKVDSKSPIRINFICTHNSRRSHLTQIWMQVAASYYGIPNLTCYSGGTEQTAMYPMVATVLKEQGLDVFKIAEGENPIYAIKYGDNEVPIIGFSKKYDAAFNPNSDFAAVMTCSQADGGCPFIAGAERRIPITFEDPKAFDGTENQQAGYFNRSLVIANEMFYIVSQIKK